MPAQTVSLQQVCLQRDGTPLFDQLDLEIPELRTALIGCNGSGKSSLARLLNGLLEPDSGSVCVAGMSEPGNLRNATGFIFQNPDHQILFPTVMEELCFGLKNLGQSSHQASQAAREVLASYGLESWTERSVYSLSEGQKQLVCILSVILMKPALLVLDEPFSALDIINRKRLSSILEKLPLQIIMITHDLDLIEDYERVIWLDNGSIRDDGTPEQVLKNYRDWAAQQ